MESRGSFRLTMRQGPTPGKIFEMVKDVVTLGRDVNNDIVINDAEVSRNHARFTAQSGGYLMEDLASTNGSFINGQRLIGPKLLSPGDMVGMGETVVLEYSAVAPDAGATVVAGAPRFGAQAFQAPPPAPEPEPEPEPAPAEPAYSAPEPYAPEPYAPPQPAYEPMPAPAPFAPPPAKAPANRRNLIIGGVCGCLTLCACAAIGTGAAFWAQIQQFLIEQGIPIQ